MLTTAALTISRGMISCWDNWGPWYLRGLGMIKYDKKIEHQILLIGRCHMISMALNSQTSWYRYARAEVACGRRAWSEGQNIPPKALGSGCQDVPRHPVGIFAPNRETPKGEIITVPTETDWGQKRTEVKQWREAGSPGCKTGAKTCS